MKPSLIVHGGAGQIDPELHAARLEGIRVAAHAGWELLQRGASASSVFADTSRPHPVRLANPCHKKNLPVQSEPLH